MNKNKKRNEYLVGFLKLDSILKRCCEVK